MTVIRRKLKVGELVEVHPNIDPNSDFNRMRGLAIVLGESHRENVLVRPVDGGYDFTINEIGCEKVKKNETIL